MPTTTIKPLTEYNNYSVGTLMFPSDYHDSAHYYDLPAIRQKYNFHSRSKVHILTKVFQCDTDYINAPANTDNKQRYSTCCPEECEGAFESSTMPGYFSSWYPYGDVMIFGETLEELTQRKKDKEYQRRCNSIRKEIIKKIKEDTDEKRLAMIMNLIENFELENVMELVEEQQNSEVND